LRLLADRIDAGEDCRGYAGGLHRAADLVEQHTCEWHWLPAPVRRPLEELLEKRRADRG